MKARQLQKHGRRLRLAFLTAVSGLLTAQALWGNTYICKTICCPNEYREVCGWVTNAQQCELIGQCDGSSDELCVIV